jgi:hypothetical protein
MDKLGFRLRGPRAGPFCAIVAGLLFLASPRPESSARALPNSPAGPVNLADDSTQLDIGGGSIHVNLAAGRSDLPGPRLYAWVTRAAQAVSVYFGNFPVTKADVFIRLAEGRDGVFGGFTFCPDSGVLTTRIRVGEHTTEEQLADDWTMTHEFVHFAFPSMSRNHHWIEEGLATYVEPIARAQAGQISAASVWMQLVEGLPQGQPGPGDEGLDHTHTWGRTYWGGALYCLLADVGIRRATANRNGLEDALRAILAAGGTMDQDWEIERALTVGDKATGTTVLTDLYLKMKDAPAPADLDALWRELGVSMRGREVKFHDDAPLAAIRRAITEPPRARLAPSAVAP